MEDHGALSLANGVDPLAEQHHDGSPSADDAEGFVGGVE